MQTGNLQESKQAIKPSSLTVCSRRRKRLRRPAGIAGRGGGVVVVGEASQIRRFRMASYTAIREWLRPGRGKWRRWIVPRGRRKALAGEGKAGDACPGDEEGKKGGGGGGFNKNPKMPSGTLDTVCVCLCVQQISPPLLLLLLPREIAEDIAAPTRAQF